MFLCAVQLILGRKAARICTPIWALIETDVLLKILEVRKVKCRM